jgi:hypothetical protein
MENGFWRERTFAGDAQNVPRGTLPPENTSGYSRQINNPNYPL